MADDPTPPEGFWEDFQNYVMEQFKAGKTVDPPTAPAPDPKADPPADPPKPPKQRKSWFNNES